MAQQPVLVYDRIDANRRNTLLLLALFALVLLPVAAPVAAYLTELATVFLLLSVFRGLSEDVLSQGWVAAIGVGAIIALAILVVMAYLLYRYSCSVVLRMTGARPVERQQEPDLWRTIENLCLGAGLPQPRAYVVESPAPNAFATGLAPEHASLVVTRGLLQLLEPLELEGVIAHELSHIGNHDTRLSAVVAAAVGFLRLPFAILLAIIRFLFRLHWVVGVIALLFLGQMGLAVLYSIIEGVALGLELMASERAFAYFLLGSSALSFYIFLIAPLLGLLLRLVILRQRDLLADADAALLTRYPEGLARALAKMSAAGSLKMKVSPAMAHLYIVDPLARGVPFWDRILPTHPPIEERIHLLAKMGEIPPSVLQSAQEAGAKFSPAEAHTTIGDAAYPETKLPIAEEAASPETRQAPVAFRLTGPETTLYQRPGADSAQLAQLPAGALITVLATEGDFLQVLTASDSVGYISRTPPMNQVALPTLRRGQNPPASEAEDASYGKDG